MIGAGIQEEVLRALVQQHAVCELLVANVDSGPHERLVKHGHSMRLPLVYRREHETGMSVIGRSLSIVNIPFEIR